MPRQRGRSAAPARSTPSRPTVAAARPNVTPPQQASRSTSTAAHPPAVQQPQASGGSGLFGQMASTAAGVAVGSSIGHAIGGFFGGGSSQPAEAVTDSAVQSQAQEGSAYQSTSDGRNCETDAKAFTKCLDENKGSDYQMSICGWYLEQLVSSSDGMILD
ncbi:hypothetical protein MMC30_005834 [Trapelia coarctata]|nr:hypothetical protein [Trapelia coarctata]